jgi:hypothetical protein
VSHIVEKDLNRLFDAFLSPLNQGVLDMMVDGLTFRKHLYNIFHDSVENGYEFRQFPDLAMRMMDALNGELQKIGLEKATFDETEDRIH